jgi:hypothetical protein
MRKRQPYAGHRSSAKRGIREQHQQEMPQSFIDQSDHSVKVVKIVKIKEHSFHSEFRMDQRLAHDCQQRAGTFGVSAAGITVIQ